MKGSMIKSDSDWREVALGHIAHMLKNADEHVKQHFANIPADILHARIDQAYLSGSNAVEIYDEIVAECHAELVAAATDGQSEWERSQNTGDVVTKCIRIMHSVECLPSERAFRNRIESAILNAFPLPGGST